MPDVFDLDDEAFLKAVGYELKLLREKRGWKRADFVARLPGGMPVNTYACYEQGVRPCPLPALVIFCHALGTTVGDVIDAALEALGIQPAPASHAALTGRLDRIETVLVGVAELLTPNAPG